MITDRDSAVPPPGRSGYVDLTAGRFHYRRWASVPSAPTVIAMHGNGSSWTTWSRLGPALSEAGMDVLALDLRGNGASPRPPAGSYGLPEVAGDLHDFIDALHLEAPALIGHCWGAAVAVALATGMSSDRVPPALSSVVLEELPSDLASTADQPVVREFMKLMRSPGEYAAGWVSLVCRNWHPADRESFLANVRGTDTGIYLSTIRDGASAGPLLPRLARLDVPALVLRGNPLRGGMLDDECWRLARQYLPASSAAHEIPGTGHEIHRGDYPAFMQLVEDFLRRTLLR